MTRRRRLLAGVGAGVLGGTAGCLRLINGGSGGAPSDATFEFDYAGAEAGRLTVTHAGGPAVSAGNLELRSDRGVAVTWPELGSTAETASEDVTQGASATLGASVLNWPNAVAPDELIRVVYRSEDDSPTTLAKFRADTMGTATTTDANATTDDSTTDDSTTESNTTTATAAAFVDQFDDGTFHDRWEYTNADQENGTTLREDGDVLYHEAPFSYEGGRGTIATTEPIQTDGGHVTVTARLRSHLTDYWGYGIGLALADGGVWLKEHKWEQFDRLAAFGVEDRPDEYASDYDYYGEQTHKAKFASAASTTSWIEYSMTVDPGAGELVAVRRGDETFEPGLALRGSGEPVRVLLGGGGGHEVEYDEVSVVVE